jgi:hypothetical protein
MNLDVAVLLWGALVTVIVVAGIVTGEWKEKLYGTPAEPPDEAE